MFAHHCLATILSNGFENILTRNVWQPKLIVCVHSTAFTAEKNELVWRPVNNFTKPAIFRRQASAAAVQTNGRECAWNCSTKLPMLRISSLTALTDLRRSALHQQPKPASGLVEPGTVRRRATHMIAEALRQPGPYFWMLVRGVIVDH
jgi:hypothetical protein